MATNRQRKRHRLLALVAAASVAVLVGLLVVGLWILMRAPDSPPSATPPTAQPSSGIPTTPGSKPRPEFQDASCPDVMMISIPGTWESWPTDDPLNPTQFPRSLMLGVSGPIVGSFPAERVQVYTVPYTAQFHNPFSADGQMSYNDSRAEGTRVTLDEIKRVNQACPLTSFIFVGFSQGAIIAGDIASDIGNGRGPIDQDLVLGVTLIADGRRQDTTAQEVGPNPPGQGAEITLHEVPMLKQLGLDMTGPRPGGFGALNDRTFQICAPGDLICAAPTGAFSIANLPQTLATLSGGAGAPVHALYNTPQFWNIDGQPATVWTQNWARDLVQNAPTPKHG